MSQDFRGLNEQYLFNFKFFFKCFILYRDAEQVQINIPAAFESKNTEEC